MLEDNHPSTEFESIILFEGKGETCGLAGGDVVCIDPGNMCGFGNGFQKGSVIGGSDVDLAIGSNGEFTGVDESRNDGTDSRYVEDIFN